jgi:hypothetical protein
VHRSVFHVVLQSCPTPQPSVAIRATHFAAVVIYPKHLVSDRDHVNTICRTSRSAALRTNQERTWVLWDFSVSMPTIEGYIALPQPLSYDANEVVIGDAEGAIAALAEVGF